MYILFRVVYDLQRRKESIDLHGVKESVVVVYVCRQIIFRQYFIKNIAVILHASHQYDYISLLERSFAAFLSIEYQGPKRVLYNRGCGVGLFLRLHYIL